MRQRDALKLGMNKRTRVWTVDVKRTTTTTLCKLAVELHTSVHVGMNISYFTNKVEGSWLSVAAILL